MSEGGSGPLPAHGSPLPSDFASVYSIGYSLGETYRSGVSAGVGDIRLPVPAGLGGTLLPGDVLPPFGRPTPIPVNLPTPTPLPSPIPSTPLDVSGRAHSGTVIERQLILNVSQPMNVEAEFVGMEAWANVGN